MNNVLEDFISLIIGRLQTTVPALQFVGQDAGQLEMTGTSAPASIVFPCVLVDLRELVWEDLPGNLQRGMGSLQIRIATGTAGSNTSSAYTLEQAIHKALQGMVPGSGFGKLLRRSSDSELLENKLHLRVVKYAVSITDISTADNSIKTARPNPVIHRYN